MVKSVKCYIFVIQSGEVKSSVFNHYYQIVYLQALIYRWGNGGQEVAEICLRSLMVVGFEVTLAPLPQKLENPRCEW